MKFFLTTNGERSAILTEEQFLRSGEAKIDTCDAESWLHAKAAFGFELFEFQSRLLPLDEQGRRREVILEKWRDSYGLTERQLRDVGAAYNDNWLREAR